MTASFPAFAHTYLQAPFSIFDKATATALAQVGWQQLAAGRQIDAAHYSIANCLGAQQAQLILPRQSALMINETLLLEEPDFDHLRAFYDEHGLEPLPIAELFTGHVPAKLCRALAMLAEVAPAHACVLALTHSVQVLRQPDPEIDVSYSHPAIPFSVFVTVCEEDSELAALRVAEAVLHETMHLHLTLLESVVDLVQTGSLAVYYSPWRDEDRPVRGVLHGLFVFRAVQAFYQALITQAGCTGEATDFASERLLSIAQEVQLVADFMQADGLTAAGRQLAANLLEYRVEASNPRSYANSQ